MTESIQARLLDTFTRESSRRCLTFVDDKGHFEWLTNAEVGNRTREAASKLAQAGLKRGEACVLVLPSDERCAFLILGTLWLGALPLLVAPPVIQGFNPVLLRTIESVIRRTKPGVVVLDEGLRNLLAPSLQKRSRVVGADELTAGDPGFDVPVLPSEVDIAALQLTSGTTGAPKVCVWSQRGVLAALDGMADAMALSRDDVCLNWTPLYHDMGLVNNFLLCLTAGVPLALMSPLDFIKRPSLWLQALSDTGATVTWSPNFGYSVAAQRARDSELEGVDLTHVRGFWNAAERIHYETVVAFEQRFARYGVRHESLKMNFGCAENVGGATFTPAGESYRAERVDIEVLQNQRIARVVAGDEERPSQWVVGSGKPHAGMTIDILSPAGRVLPEGHVGRVALKSPSRIEGYLGDEAATRRAIRGEHLLTGDIGYMRDGELFWTGRLKERLKVRGRQVDPSEFEAALLEVDDLRKGCFAVFGIDDAEQGTERVVVVSELVDAPVQPYETIASAVRERVGTKVGLVPSEVLLVEKGLLTKTSSGKRRHLYFRERYLRDELPALHRSVTGRPRRHESAVPA